VGLVPGRERGELLCLQEARKEKESPGLKRKKELIGANHILFRGEIMKT